MRIDFRLLFFSALLMQAGAFARFSGELSPEERGLCGLKKLDDTQVACIDALVQRELTLAQQGRTKGFAKTFTQRRTDMETKAAGLLVLSDEEKAAIDAQVALRLARTATASTPTLKGDDSVTLEVKKKGFEVHGALSLVVGANSRGGSFYGGAMETTFSDPSRGLDITVGYSEIHSKGMGCWGPYGYGYGRNAYGWGNYSWADGDFGYHPYGYYGASSGLNSSDALNEPGACVRKLP